MSYLPMGDFTAADFNSTKYPGVCKPSTVSALVSFKALQQQLNRIASTKGVPTIAVDGDVGPGTVGLVSKFAAEIAAYAASIQDVGQSAQIALLAGTGNCVAVASVADVIESEAEMYADNLKAPSSPPAPKAKASTLVLANGSEVAAPLSADILSAWTNLGSTGQIVALAAAAGLGYYVFASGKRRKRARR